MEVPIAEIMLGRHVRADAITTIRKVSPNRGPWWEIGVAGVFSAFPIMAFYCLLSTDPKVTSQAFTSLLTSPAQSLWWQWIVLIIVGFIIILGVTKGIERTTKRLMPILFLLLIILVILSLALPGAGAVLTFLFKPDFSKLTGGVFIVLFFVLAAIAATGAMLSIVEVPVAFLNERLPVNPTLATIITMVLLGLVGSTAALSNSLLANFKLFGKTLFDLFDFSTSNVLLPLGSLFLALFAGWVRGKQPVFQELTNGGALKNTRLVSAFFFVLRFVTPVLGLLILLHGLNII